MNFKQYLAPILATLRGKPKSCPPGYFCYQGYQIPDRLVQLTGSGPEVFDVLSKNQISYLQKYLQVQPTHHVVEIGCGIGKGAIPLTRVLSSRGSYLGIDVIADSIAWCTAHITPRHPNFRFVHFDVKDKLHHPEGRLEQQDILVPVESASIDSIFLMSVFTHLLESDIEHYLAEFYRILVPGGKILATVFIYDDLILESAKRTNLTQYGLFFDYPHADGCRINNLEYPTGAVAYTLEKLQDLITASGLQLTQPPLRGHWSGDARYFAHSVDGQDMLVLRKPSHAQPMRSLP